MPAACGSRQEAAAAVLAGLGRLSPDELLDVRTVAATLGFGPPADLEELVSPHGYRVLAKIGRLPRPVAQRVGDHFGGLQKLLAATVDDLQAVDGVGENRARTVREGLSRLAEASILERYV